MKPAFGQCPKMTPPLPRDTDRPVGREAGLSASPRPPPTRTGPSPRRWVHATKYRQERAPAFRLGWGRSPRGRVPPPNTVSCAELGAPPGHGPRHTGSVCLLESVTQPLQRGRSQEVIPRVCEALRGVPPGVGPTAPPAAWGDVPRYCMVPAAWRMRPARPERDPLQGQPASPRTGTRGLRALGPALLPVPCSPGMLRGLREAEGVCPPGGLGRLREGSPPEGPAPVRRLPGRAPTAPCVPRRPTE